MVSTQGSDSTNLSLIWRTGSGQKTTTISSCPFKLETAVSMPQNLACNTLHKPQAVLLTAPTPLHPPIPLKFKLTKTMTRHDDKTKRIVGSNGWGKPDGVHVVFGHGAPHEAELNEGLGAPLLDDVGGQRGGTQHRGVVGIAQLVVNLHTHVHTMPHSLTNVQPEEEA